MYWMWTSVLWKFQTEWTLLNENRTFRIICRRNLTTDVRLWRFSGGGLFLNNKMVSFACKYLYVNVGLIESTRDKIYAFFKKRRAFHACIYVILVVWRVSLCSSELCDSKHIELKEYCTFHAATVRIKNYENYRMINDKMRPWPVHICI